MKEFNLKKVSSAGGLRHCQDCTAAQRWGPEALPHLHSSAALGACATARLVQQHAKQQEHSSRGSYVAEAIASPLRGFACSVGLTHACGLALPASSGMYQ